MVAKWGGAGEASIPVGLCLCQPHVDARVCVNDLLIYSVFTFSVMRVSCLPHPIPSADMHVPGTRYLGCYHILSGEFLDHVASADDCRDKAEARAYQYFFTHNGGECFGSSEWDYITSRGHASTCFMACARGNAALCGGSGSINVFEIRPGRNSVISLNGLSKRVVWHAWTGCVLGTTP